jgi:hypothetical protein
MFIHHRKHAYGPPRAITGIALLFYMEKVFVPHRKHAYGPPWLVSVIYSALCRDIFCA